MLEDQGGFSKWLWRYLEGAPNNQIWISGVKEKMRILDYNKLNKNSSISPYSWFDDGDTQERKRDGEVWWILI